MAKSITEKEKKPVEQKKKITSVKNKPASPKKPVVKPKKSGAPDASGTTKRTTNRKSRNIKRVQGILSVNAKGFGFVNIDSDEQDVFIPLDNMNAALAGDKVSVEIVRQETGRNPVGRIIKVLEQGTSEIIGVFKMKEGQAIVVPTDERFTRSFTIATEHQKPMKGGKPPRDGDVVVIQRGKWNDPAKKPSGRIIDILGKPEDGGMDLLIVAKSSGLSLEFPEAVMQETAKLTAPNINKELKKREDLRDRLCFTIDPETARDFDDAVSLVQLENGMFELGVHIADVSYYVREGTALDAEAFERGTSVYLVNEVIPMLPERISNDLCSLKPNEDRFAFSVIMEIDSRGTIHNYRIRESIIRSKQRFSYEEVEEIIHGKKHTHAKTIHLMMLLSLVLRRAREEMGSIDFDIPVPEISLDENGVPFEVRPSERLDANRLIEEFMLAANLTVARHVAITKDDTPPRPFIYRVHERPDEQSIRSFLDLLARLGLKYHVSHELESEDYRKILGIIENLDYKDFAEKVALRSMTKAVYQTENLGHFGLAFDAYTHFTSPIRRYPDLVVHRLLKTYIAQENPTVPSKPSGKKIKANFLTNLNAICKQSSNREIRAVQAEREYTKIKAMQFLADKIGNTYDGVIAGITSFGFFVELTHFLIEGLVHISELKDDTYIFDKDNYTLTGKKNGTVYRLGDPVNVTIKTVSKEEKRADFVLAK
jgi:ribonuclease R